MLFYLLHLFWQHHHTHIPNDLTAHRLWQISTTHDAPSVGGNDSLSCGARTGIVWLAIDFRSIGCVVLSKNSCHDVALNYIVCVRVQLHFVIFHFVQHFAFSLDYFVRHDGIITIIGNTKCEGNRPWKVEGKAVVPIMLFTFIIDSQQIAEHWLTSAYCGRKVKVSIPLRVGLKMHAIMLNACKRYFNLVTALGSLGNTISSKWIKFIR